VILLADPVFQLNVAIWMLQARPEGAPWDPVLREAGYSLESVGRRIVLPLELRSPVAAIVADGSNPQEASPDVGGLHTRCARSKGEPCWARPPA
jgi:hypothetical protein